MVKGESEDGNFFSFSLEFLIMIIIFGGLLYVELNDDSEFNAAVLADASIKCSDELSEERDKRLDLELKYYQEKSDWKCIEYANKTTLNPEYFDNCCVDVVDEDFFDITTEVGNDFVVKVNHSIKFRVTYETLYNGGKICVESAEGESFGDFVVAGQTINSELCLSTPEFIETNETCIIKERIR